MQQKNLFYKSDFKVILAFDGGWAVPFKLIFWTNIPSRNYVACYDGHEYHNCHVLEDGRLCIAFDQHNLPMGQLRMEANFYLDDECFRDGNCHEVIKDHVVTLTDEDGTEYTLYLDMNGSSTLTTIGTLPAYYQKGEPGRDGADGQPGEKGDKGDKGDPGRDGIDGKDGKPGGILYPSFDIQNGHLIANVPTTEADLTVKLEAGHLILTV